MPARSPSLFPWTLGIALSIIALVVYRGTLAQIAGGVFGFYLLVWLYFVLKHVLPYRKSKIPCSIPWSPLGSLFELGILPSFSFSMKGFSEKQNLMDKFKSLVSFNKGGNTLCEGLDILHHKYGDTFAVWLGFDRVVILNNLNDAKFIYSQNRQDYDQAEYLRDRQKGIAPLSLSSSGGDTHKRHVAALGPMLKKFKLIPFIPLIQKNVVRLCNKWKQYDLNSVQGDNLLYDCKALMLDIICSVGFNYERDSVSNIDAANVEGSDELALALYRIINNVAAGFVWGIPAWIWNWVSAWDGVIVHARKVIQQYQMLAIRKYHEKLKACESAGGRVETSNLLELLVHSCEKGKDGKPLLSIEELFDDLTLFLFAGSDSSASVLGFALYYLSKYPRVQEKLKAEIGKICFPGGIPSLSELPSLSAEQLNQLEYCDSVIKETLRLSMTSMGASRQLFKDDVIGGFEMKCGENLLVNSVQICHDPRIWSEAEIFYPERYDTISAGVPYAAIGAFGGGHRACVGQELARLELKIALCVIMSYFTVCDTPGNTHLKTEDDCFSASIQIAVPDVRHLQVVLSV